MLIQIALKCGSVVALAGGWPMMRLAEATNGLLGSPTRDRRDLNGSDSAGATGSPAGDHRDD